MPRSLKVREDSIPIIKSSLLRNGFPSQKVLAEDLGISQSTVSNFLNGRPVDYGNFIEISRILGQEWRKIADLDGNSPLELVTALKAKFVISDRTSKFPFTQQLQQALSAAGHQVFIPEKNTAPEEYLKHSDYLVLLICDRSAVSEILLEEVRVAKELQTFNPPKPAILPICLDLPWQNSLPFDLLQLLPEIQPWQWHTNRDPSILGAEILSLLTEGLTSLSPDHEFAVSWSQVQIVISPSPQRSTECSRRSPPISPFPLPAASPELPEGQVELTSQFYIERLPIEMRCYETITQPGALIRIKAPRQMGKTSLMARILHHAEQQGSKAIALSLQLANKRVFTSSDKFLQWFCASVGQELGMLEQVTTCWELAEMIGSNQCCKAFFDQYLLPAISTPLTLGLDEVDRVFESPEIADDFFGLLRALHEEAKRRDIWKKFRLIVVHSTEVYIPLDINKSPFNVGLPIELPEFNSGQVQELAKRHGLDWQENDQVEKLMNLVGGHPYLLRLGMYHIARQDVTLERLLEDAITEGGIYSDHLRRHLWNLEKYSELMVAMKEVVTASQGVRLRSDLAFKLTSMGLVKFEGNHCIARCSLYQQYFCDRLIST